MFVSHPNFEDIRIGNLIRTLNTDTYSHSRLFHRQAFGESVETAAPENIQTVIM